MAGFGESRMLEPSSPGIPAVFILPLSGPRPAGMTGVLDAEGKAGSARLPTLGSSWA